MKHSYVRIEGVNELHVVFDHYDARTVGELFHELRSLSCFLRCHSCCWLIEQDHLGAETQYHANVETASEPRVRLTAELGKLPYSMEIGTGRQLIRQILNVSAHANYGRISLSKDQDIRLEAATTPPVPFTPVSLMATLTAMLFDFQPYLDFLGQVLEDAQRPKTVETLEPAG